MPVRKKARFHLRVWIPTIAVAFVLSTFSLWILVLDNVENYRKLDQQMVESDARMMSKAYHEYILRVVQKIDQTSQIILSEYREGHAPLDSIVKSASSIIMPDYLFQVSVVDKSGYLIFSNLNKISERIDLSDREHFRVHLEDKRDFLYISKPVLGRVSRKWSIQFTRKIFNNIGEFDGVIVLSVDPSHLANFSNSVLLGERDAIGLSRDDGTILSRVVGGTYQEQYFGTVIGSRPYMSALVPDAGVYESKSPVDGVQRFVGYQKLRDYGLVAVALFDKEAAFTRSDQALSTAYLIAGVGTFLLALASLASALAIRAVLHEYVVEQTMNAELRNAHDELAVAHSSLKMREEELVVLSETDPLCRIANRRRFMAVTEAELIRHRRYRRTFSLLVLDVDHFKAINDAHGHGVGDAVLVALANTIKTRLRETDTFARIGGEEFAVFLPETDVKGALAVAEDIRQTVSETCIDAGKGQSVDVTVSIGIACSRSDSASVSDILNSADRALYAAKRGGRNRSMVEGNRTLPV
ncbi:sensor domain-containing diguanylate cyclase [Azospirillum sp. A26]|uniref:sensor domain-containing diguanylate cyclase n=1 Tax=Azospirillum sp. A26 TaxID=3160607 RepID=UPI00366E44B1